MRITSPVTLVGSILESIILELLGVTGLLGLLEVTGFGVTELVEVTGVTGLLGVTGLIRRTVTVRWD